MLKILKLELVPLMPQTVLALGSYKALNEYDWYKLLDVTDHIKDVFVRQIEEPNQEKKLKIDTPRLVESD